MLQGVAGHAPGPPVGVAAPREGRGASWAVDLGPLTSRGSTAAALLALATFLGCCSSWLGRLLLLLARSVARASSAGRPLTRMPAHEPDSSDEEQEALQQQGARGE